MDQDKEIADIEMVGHYTMQELCKVIPDVMKWYKISNESEDTEEWPCYWISRILYKDRVMLQFVPEHIQITMRSDRGRYTPHFATTFIDYASPNYVRDLAKVFVRCHNVFGEKQCPNFSSKS